LAIEPTEVTVAAYNAHWGVGRYGASRGVRFDVAEAVRSFDADIVVVPEAWRDDDGKSDLDPLTGDGYHVETVELIPLARRHDHGRDTVPSGGGWELGLCSRFPVTARREIAMGHVPTDPAGPRYALQCSLDVEGQSIDIIGLHTSSKLWLLGPVRHILTLRRELDHEGWVPHIIAGDFNFWGPPIDVMLPRWRRTARGPTYPSRRPHSQIDHVLVRRDIEVVAAEVLPATPSDHLPIRAQLRLIDEAFR
jgi:endonuclease/exonuclease/phosphatase family metal-dependent hydrolase